MSGELQLLRVLRERGSDGGPMFQPVGPSYINVLDISGLEIGEQTYTQNETVRIRLISARFPKQYFYLDIPRGREPDNNAVLTAWVWANLHGILNDTSGHYEARCTARNAEKGNARCRVTERHLTLHMAEHGLIWASEEPAVLSDVVRRELSAL